VRAALCPQVAVYESIRDHTILRQAGSFSSTASAIALHDQTLYCLEDGKVSARNFTGVSKQVSACE
jgi:ribosomal protein L27